MTNAGQREIRMEAPHGAIVTGTLTVPPRAFGIVAFAHGSGSSRLSPRNRQVADSLHEAHLGTLLFDLLTPVEAGDRANVFDIELLGTRLLAATSYLPTQSGLEPSMPL